MTSNSSPSGTEGVNYTPIPALMVFVHPIGNLPHRGRMNHPLPNPSICIAPPPALVVGRIKNAGLRVYAVRVQIDSGLSGARWCGRGISSEL